MSWEILSALVIFCFATTITPGPNSAMLLASGVNFGFRRTIPHMLGACAGFSVMLFAVGFGLGALITGIPVVYGAVKAAGAAYLLYIAWKLAMSRSLGEQKDGGEKPMTVFQAAIFQWANAKAWVMAVTAMSAYADPTDPVRGVLLVVLVFTIVEFPCFSTWAGLGAVLRGWLSDPVRLKWFNITMALALVLSLWPLLR